MFDYEYRRKALQAWTNDRKGQNEPGADRQKNLPIDTLLSKIISRLQNKQRQS